MCAFFSLSAWKNHFLWEPVRLCVIYYCFWRSQVKLHCFSFVTAFNSYGSTLLTCSFIKTANCSKIVILFKGLIKFVLSPQLLFFTLQYKTSLIKREWSAISKIYKLKTWLILVCYFETNYIRKEGFGWSIRPHFMASDKCLQ